MGARGRREFAESVAVSDTGGELAASGWAWSKLVGIDDYCWCDEHNPTVNHDHQMELRATGSGIPGSANRRYDTFLHLAQPAKFVSGHMSAFCREPANGAGWSFTAGGSGWVKAILHTVPIKEDFDTSALVWNDIAGLAKGSDVAETICKVSGSYSAGGNYYMYPSLMNTRRTYQENMGGTVYGFQIYLELTFQSAADHFSFAIPNSDLVPKPAMGANPWFVAGHDVG